MLTRIFVLAALGSLIVSGTARADLKSFMSGINASYPGDVAGFHDRLTTRFEQPGTDLERVVLAVDTPADAVVSLWLAEQSDLPVDAVLQSYQQERPGGWLAILRSLELSMESGTVKALYRGELDWYPQVVGLH